MLDVRHGDMTEIAVEIAIDQKARKTVDRAGVGIDRRHRAEQRADAHVEPGDTSARVAAVEAQAVLAVPGDRRLQPSGSAIERLVPADLAKLVAFAQQRHPKPVRSAPKAGHPLRLWTEEAAAPRMVGIAGNPGD